MIEPTDEMVAAAWDVVPAHVWRYAEIDRDDVKQMLAAALAIVERDHEIPPRPAAALCCIGYAPCVGPPGCKAKP